MLRALRILPLCTLAALGYSNVSVAAGVNPHDCDEGGSLCTETLDPIGYNGAYTGHDEPSLLFYSDTPGSGNQMTWRIRLPADPPTFPNQLGTGGTFNFQLHPAFWVGMVMCDDQSAPNPGGSTVNGVSLPNIACTPDSDANIFDSSSVTDSHYIGRHPGTGFMEMQFYPPSSPFGCGNPNHPNQWCAALNIDSYSLNQNSGRPNNSSCLNRYGVEYVNFAFITKSGSPEGPSALIGSGGFAGFAPDDNHTLFFNSGDVLRVDLTDTAYGLKVTIHDLTTGEQGSMVASAANGFAQLLYQPSATTCATQTVDFHPAFATSSEHTRNTWTAHSYNIALSDEIGHYEYCNRINRSGGRDTFGDVFGNCVADGVHDLNTNNSLIGDDDYACVDTTDNTTGFAPNIGCFGTDTDFSGVPYQLVWPGTNPQAHVDRALHSTPISFASPLFTDSVGDQRNYGRVAFEVDLPRIEAADFGGSCNRTTGAGCTNPPPNANFYPIYTTQADEQRCRWSLGGPFIPGTTNSFGGNSATEYGPYFASVFPGPAGPRSVIENFRRVLSSNPCANN
ncbi:MAG: hypothetical protein E6K32_11555 [Gammaproteobacteria bacterium]|nr:MAG: hypothetical protein E6K32_11555 [Gammaproteobacteria bacterium]